MQIAQRIAAITDQLMRGTIEPPRARATLYALQTASVALKMPDGRSTGVSPVVSGSVSTTERNDPPCPTPPLLTAHVSASGCATASPRRVCRQTEAAGDLTKSERLSLRERASKPSRKSAAPLRS